MVVDGLGLGGLCLLTPHRGPLPVPLQARLGSPPRWLNCFDWSLCKLSYSLAEAYLLARELFLEFGSIVAQGRLSLCYYARRDDRIGV